MIYHQTKNLLFVKVMLGHTDLRSTIRYTQLITMGKDEYHVKAARTAKEAINLIEQGFEYVCEMEDVKIFRKRK